MTAHILPTPADLTITPRDRRFGRERRAKASLARRKHRSDCNLQCALEHLSGAARPISSKASAQFRDGAPPKLADEIKAFTTQEAIHSREHDAFNKRAEHAGYDLTKLEAQVEKRLAITRERPPIVNVAATMALEHFTAILAHQLLADPKHLDGADQEAAELWRWHAVEEIEHKGVAYDTWLHATRALAAVQALEGQGEGDALRHPQLPRRPDFRRARTDAPGRSDGLRGLGEAALVPVDPARHVPQDRRRVGQIFPSGLPPVERGRPRSARRIRGERHRWRGERSGRCGWRSRPPVPHPPRRHSPRKTAAAASTARVPLRRGRN